MSAINRNILKSYAFKISLFPVRNLSSSTIVPNIQRKLEEAQNCEYRVREFKIPSIGGHIAGKLWEGKDAEMGNSSTPILCMHGWLDNAGSFDTLLPLIMKNNRTAVCIDFPGHGLSSHVAPIHYDAHVESMLAIRSVLKYFNWGKVSIVGHSLGAIVGFVYSAVFPENVERYIALENMRPIPKNCRKELRYALLKISEIDERNSGLSNFSPTPTYDYDEILNRFYEGRGGSINLDACKILLKRGAIELSDSKFKFAHDVKAGVPTGLWRFAPSHTEELAENIKCPVCFIKGEPGGDYEPRENYHHILEIIKKNSGQLVEYHLVPGSHHFHMNDPYPVAPIISNFLDS